MSVKAWNALVGYIILFQIIVCVGVLLISDNANVMSAALIWMVIICPMTFGFVIPEE